MTLRTITKDGAPWFVAADVCRALGYSVKRDGSVNVTQAVSWLTAPEVSTTETSGKGQYRLKVVSESGLYTLILRSNKPEAKAFRHWVTSVVLPAIRKDGAYIKGEEKVVHKLYLMTKADMVKRSYGRKAQKVLDTIYEPYS